METLKRTNQLAWHVMSFPLKRHLNSRFEWLSDMRTNEKVSTDPMFANVAAVDGSTCAQVFWGFSSHIIDVCGMKKESDFCNVHQDFLRDEGMPIVLHHDNSKTQQSDKVKELHQKYSFKASQPTAKPCQISGYQVAQDAH